MEAPPVESIEGGRVLPGSSQGQPPLVHHIWRQM